MLTTRTEIADVELSASGHVHQLSAMRLAFTGATVAAASFLLCWAVAVFAPGARATHMYIQLFTPADVASTKALIEGLCWSLVVGLITGALVALAYNLSAALERR